MTKTSNFASRLLDPRCRAISSRCLAIVSLIVVAAAPTCALAQQYESLPYKRLSSSRRQIEGILKGTTPLQGSEERFDAFFNEYIFAELAPADPQKLSEIGMARADFRKRYLISRVLKNPAATERLNSLAMETMKAVIEGNFHPGVKYNALLLIGDLDQQPGVDGSNGKPPVPLPEASNYLLTMLDAGNRPDDESVKDALLMSTLIGLTRHAKYGLTDEQKAVLTSKMLEIVNQQKPPAGRLPDVHVWYRTQAADVLGALGEAGSGNEVISAVRSLFIEESASNDQRCWAALAISKLQFDPKTEEVASALVFELGDFAVLAFREEMDIGAERMTEGSPLGGRRRAPVLRGGRDLDALHGAGGLGPGGREAARGRPGAAGRPNPRGRDNERRPQPAPNIPVDTVFPRRELAFRIDCASEALKAVEPAATAPQQDLAKEVRKQISVARKALEDQYMEDHDMLKQMMKASQAMETALAAARVADEAAAPDDAVDAADGGDEFTDPTEEAAS